MTQISVESLLQGLQLLDPRLYQILQELNRRMSVVEADLFPLVQQSQLEAAGAAEPLSAPATFDFVFTPITVRLSWSAVEGAFGYEVRKAADPGVIDWDTATFLFRTPSLQADIDPLLVGSHLFLIKTIDLSGNYSTTPKELVVTVPAISGVTISKAVIDNNVLLNWSAAVSTFRVLHYEVYKDGALIGTVDSTFFTRFENVAGTYTYRVLAVDIAGNVGPNSDISVDVLTPPDYALTDQRTSDLLGTRTNVIFISDGPKLLCNWASETWEDHFLGRVWDHPQDQIDAGYPIYIQPANLTGSYEEVIDYGTVLSNVIATVTFNFTMITPTETMTVVVRMATSPDDITYSAFTDGASQFIASMRYLKLRLEFTGSSDEALMELFNLVISLNVKRENDGGEIEADETDVGGTEVLFNKDFKDVESITATAKSVTEPYVVIIDFNDVPDPDGFNVYVFDTTGNRVTKTIEWKARGIV